MGTAVSATDETRIYFEDDGGDGPPVIFYAGLLDPIDLVRTSTIANALNDMRRIFIDHRGVGLSDKPVGAAAYTMLARVQDAVTVLDTLGIERAHFVGTGWGARLGFGIGEYAPERVLTLSLGGQHPYQLDKAGPIVSLVTKGLVDARTEGMEALVRAIESFSGGRLPDQKRNVWLDNDQVAIESAWIAALNEGPVTGDLGAWRIPCLIYAAAGDTDFHEGARRAASEIPGAVFMSLKAEDHYSIQNELEPVIEAIRELISAGP